MSTPVTDELADKIRHLYAEADEAGQPPPGRPTLIKLTDALDTGRDGGGVPAGESNSITPRVLNWSVGLDRCRKAQGDSPKSTSPSSPPLAVYLTCSEGMLPVLQIAMLAFVPLDSHADFHMGIGLAERGGATPTPR